MSAILRTLVGCLLVAAAVIAIEGQSNGQPVGREAARPEVRGMVKAVDVGKNTLTIGLAQRRGEPAVEDQTYTLAKEVEVAHGSGSRGRSVFREGKLADLPAGTTVTLTLSADQKAVESILAEGPVVRGQLKSVDAEKHTLTVSQQQGRGEPAADEKTYALARAAEVAVDDGHG